jgi:hypothetical protein
MQGLGARVDHLVFGVPELEAGIAEIERLLGVRAVMGGKHTGRGTHNALLSLGRTSYLEVIAPDPDQPTPNGPRPFGLDTLREPRLVTWAIAVRDIERHVEDARAAGYDPGRVLNMSRALPESGELRWKLTLRLDAFTEPVRLAPFLIEWEPGTHPAQTSPGGCLLLDLEGEHPHPEPVRAALDALGVSMPVTEAGRPALLATIECPRGTVVLS